MTVREIVKVIRRGDLRIKLSWNNFSRDFDPEDPVELDAFGRYVVKDVDFFAYEHGETIAELVEIHIAMAPVSEKEVPV